MKIFGCLLILISSVSCAYFYEKSLKNKILILGEIIDFIKYAKNQIEYFSTPIDKIFTDFECKYINETIKSRRAENIFGKDKERIPSIFQFELKFLLVLLFDCFWAAEVLLVALFQGKRFLKHDL